MADANSGGQADPMVGTLLGGCKIEARVGGGGMGVVYRATDRHLKRTVALKLLKAEAYGDPEMRKRFEREAASAAGIEHDHVVPIYSIDADDQGRPYIVMAYVDGPDLSKVVADGVLEPRRALRIFDQMADAIEAVHQHGFVHRDIKPANILLKNAGTESEHAMLTDFGIAKAHDSQTALTFGAIGTPDYMAPEVADLQRATELSDQYSLALVLYRMLAGERLFEGLEMPRAHRDEPVPDLADALPHASRAVRTALAKALEKDPTRRFPSVAAFAEGVGEPDSEEALQTRPLQTVMEEVLASSGALTPEELAAAIEQREDQPADVTSLRVEGRAQLFSQLFHRRPDGRIELRGD